MGSSTVQTDCFYPFLTLLALTDQFLQTYFNLIEPNSVFTAFGLISVRRNEGQALAIYWAMSTEICQP